MEFTREQISGLYSIYLDFGIDNFMDLVKDFYNINYDFDIIVGNYMPLNIYIDQEIIDFLLKIYPNP